MFMTKNMLSKAIKEELRYNERHARLSGRRTNIYEFMKIKIKKNFD